MWITIWHPKPSPHSVLDLCLTGKAAVKPAGAGCWSTSYTRQSAISRKRTLNREYPSFGFSEDSWAGLHLQ